MRIAIVGGGISGLATAHHLRQGLQAAGRAAELVIFEARGSPGGTMRTSRRQGFIMEWGPNGFLTNKPYSLELARELGMEGRLLRSSDLARKRFVFSGGRLHRLPETPGAFLGSDLLSVPGRLRVLAEPFIAPDRSGADESVADFARRRLGSEAMEKLIEPMTAGVFAGNPDQLSLASCFPRIRELEARYGGLVKAMLRLRWERLRKGAQAEMSAGPGGVLTSFDTGVQALVEVLAGNFSKELQLGAEVVAVGRRGSKFQLAVKYAEGRSESEADAVVVAAPAYAAGVLLRGLDGALAAELAGIPYAPVAVVALAYEAGDLGAGLDGFGFLVPRLEGRRILGALWDSSVFPNRAPQGKALIRVMVGGARQPELARLPEAELLALVRGELKELIGVSAQPVLERVFFHERGIPQYLKGHGQRLDRIAKRLDGLPGLQLNSNAYRGVSLNDCVLQSKLAAQRLLKGWAGW
ncbi:MAG: protoporphyrinogen oxidase [Elusimicrobia bacterium]|nr:protoporphyrinogen oxidase [Elusimicrobiota bacterium]